MLRLDSRMRLGRVTFLALLLVVGIADAARADLLTQYPSNIGKSGEIFSIYGNVYDDTDGSLIYHAYTVDLEYAVYYGAAFGQPFSSRYVYAYQFFNHSGPDPDWGFNETSEFSGEPINAFTIGVNGDKQLADIYSLGGSGEVPSSWVWNLGANSVVAEFFTAGQDVGPGDHSAILYFSSPFGPGRASAGFGGAASVSVDDPLIQPYSPYYVTPEPATGVLTIFGGIALLSAGAIRRVYGRIWL
jgi:hypothetical protein